MPNKQLIELWYALLNDDSGVSEKGYRAMVEHLKEYFGTRPIPVEIEAMMNQFESCDGRVFLDGVVFEEMPETVEQWYKEFLQDESRIE